MEKDRTQNVRRSAYISIALNDIGSRNLFYTAISRARKQVQLYGSRQAVGIAMQKELSPRLSMLVEKTRVLMA